MKTNRNSRGMRLLAAVALALSFTTLPASAQSTYKGKFSLTQEARWGTVTLPAGDYSFTLSSATRNGVVAVQHEESGKAAGMILMRSHEDRTFSDTSTLVLMRNGGKSFVSSMELKELGMTCYFSLPKAEQQFIAQGPVLFQRVPISISGK